MEEQLKIAAVIPEGMEAYTVGEKYYLLGFDYMKITEIESLPTEPGCMLFLFRLENGGEVFGHYKKSVEILRLPKGHPLFKEVNTPRN